MEQSANQALRLNDRRLVTFY